MGTLLRPYKRDSLRPLVPQSQSPRDTSCDYRLNHRLTLVMQTACRAGEKSVDLPVDKSVTTVNGDINLARLL